MTKAKFERDLKTELTLTYNTSTADLCATSKNPSSNGLSSEFLNWLDRLCSIANSETQHHLEGAHFDAHLPSWSLKPEVSPATTACESDLPVLS